MVQTLRMKAFPFKNEKMSHICIIVLGDTGRSPRMQYHAHSFAEMNAVERVSLMGFTGEPCVASVRSHRKIQDIRINPSDISYLRRIPLLHAVVKGVSLVISLLWNLWCLSSYDVILIQNPPALPALLAALLADLLPWRSSRIILDWHNLGFAMFEERLGAKHIVVKLSKVLEMIAAQFVHKHLCVSQAMSKWLSENFGVDALVMYDRPASSFRRGGSTLKQRHELFLKLKFTHRDIFGLNFEGQNEKEKSLISSAPHIATSDIITTLQTQAIGDKIELLNDSQRIPIVISSTSWTPDEDFNILLHALLTVECTMTACAVNPLYASKVLVCVTGKGPMKKAFEDEVHRYEQEGKLGRCVRVKTLWLEPEDYPVFVGCCTLGVSLHTSTSGLDLPMKVLDMFGSGLPVCAVRFPTLPELVQHNVNGLIFNGTDGKGDELAAQLLHCLFNVTCPSKVSAAETILKQKNIIDHLCGDNDNATVSNESGKDLMTRLQLNVAKTKSWDENWNAVVPPAVNRLIDDRGLEELQSRVFWFRQLFRGLGWAILFQIALWVMQLLRLLRVNLRI